MRDCQNLDEVRERIDQLDQHIIQLLSERSQYVRQAAAFKKDKDAVKAPARVESVIHKVRQLAVEHALNPSIAEKVYRAMIAGFIEDELQEHERINPSNR
ncbi:chorismate mutase [Paenibacillus sp. PK4536]|jgi:isochorismate pyruvate lyase|uniref:Isochorismate lyase n=1 Tax=Paenibacillus nuruki TaxID=1886670 RepID=A0A1E3KXX6_9BACL|nr:MULTISPECIES: chorismate mutase [Paenibacillus]ODP26243.1 Isochorismate lyase [Paenibacillus nuruki]WIM40883.1 chorismate mutase [Paenibacillus sp. PK4536]